MNSLLRESFGIVQLLAIRGSGLLALFLVNVLIARNYGAATQGLFQIGLGWVIVGSTVLRLGQDQLMLRSAAEGKAKDDLAAVRQKLLASLRLAAPVLALGTVFTTLFFQLGFYEINLAGSSLFLSIMVLAIFPTGILLIVTETMRGWQHVNSAMAWQGSIPQVLLLILIAVAILVSNQNSLWISIFYTAVFATVAGTVYSQWSRDTRSTNTVEDAKNAFKLGYSFWISAVLLCVAAWIDVVILGYLATPKDVGVFSAVLRTGGLVGTAIQVFSAGAVSALAVLYAKGEMEKFAAVTRLYFWIFRLASIPFMIAFFIFPKHVMSIWGAEFEPYAELITIYGGFQIYQFFISISAILLMLMGVEKLLVRVQFMLLVMKTIMVVLGYYVAGLLGTVWAVGLSLFISNNIMLYLFLRKMKSHGVPARDLVAWKRRGA